MKQYVDREIIQKSTGQSYADYANIMIAIKYYISKTGISDFLLSPADYIECIDFISSDPIIQGRTIEDRPYFSYFGIKFTMLSIEDANKYKVLK